MAIENRRRFQYFLNFSNREAGDYTTFYLQDDNKGVIGQEVVLSDNMKVVYYFWPIKTSEAILMMCIDTDAKIEEVLTNISEYDMGIYRRPWPNFITALENGIHGRLHLPSIIAVDIHSKKSYFTSLLLSNIKLDEIEKSDYILEKVKELLRFTAQMVSEMSDNDLTFVEKAKVIGASVVGQAGNILRLIRVLNMLN